MAEAVAEFDRTSSELVVLHDTLSWREFHEIALRRAGFGQVNTYPASLEFLQAHISLSNENRNVSGGECGHRRADLVVYGIEPRSETSWENLRAVRGVFDGPMLATCDAHHPDVHKRVMDLGVNDYLVLSDFGEEALELKVETALTAHRINQLILENDLRTQRLFVNILTVMVKILESKDPYTRFHSHSVAKWSRMIGRRCGLCEEDLDRLGLAAVFHDFGKIGIPEDILTKSSRLTDEEFTIMKAHPVIARDLLSSLELLSDLLPAITHHHERWDGRGYPDSLKAEETPLWARIIAIADSYDTMTSRRAYKEPYPPEKVREELKKGRGTQFDPTLVDHLESILDEYVKA